MKKFKENKVVVFVKEHKAVIIGIVITIGVSAICYKVSNMKTNDEVLFKYDVITSKEVENQVARKVDEEIFTELAPTIERAVLDLNKKNVVIDKQFDVGNLMCKNVKVTIDTICEN